MYGQNLAKVTLNGISAKEGDILISDPMHEWLKTGLNQKSIIPVSVISMEMTRVLCWKVWFL